MDVLDRADLPFPHSLPEFQRLFPDDAACAAYLEKARWGDGFACPHCGTRLIAREGYRVLEYALTDRGRCTGCDARTPGRWDAVVNRQIATRPFSPHSRRLRMLP